MYFMQCVFWSSERRQGLWSMPSAAHRNSARLGTDTYMRQDSQVVKTSLCEWTLCVSWKLHNCAQEDAQVVRSALFCKFLWNTLRNYTICYTIHQTPSFQYEFINRLDKFCLLYNRNADKYNFISWWIEKGWRRLSKRDQLTSTIL